MDTRRLKQRVQGLEHKLKQDDPTPEERVRREWREYLRGVSNEELLRLRSEIARSLVPPGDAR